MPRLRVRLIVMEGGERLPLLVADDGIPLFRPTQWLLHMRRARHAACNSLQADCSALKLLYLWANSHSIDIESRMLSGPYLQPHELSALVGVASQFLDDIHENCPQTKITKVLSLEKIRTRAPKGMRAVSKQTAINRLRTIADYLDWLGHEGIKGLLPVTASMQNDALRQMKTGLLARAPRASMRNVLGRREAPPPEAINRLLEVIHPHSLENPWKDIGLRVRNCLLIHLIYGLGIRRGEALGLSIDCIRWQENKVLIARTADDPRDPRKRQPLAKTRDRWLPVKDGLMDMMQQYVTHIRSKFPAARRHQFLFISHQGGAPLALVSCNKVFTNLRARIDGLPCKITPHVLRHAWNDAFSRLADEKNIDPAREEQLRSEMMGWSPTSGTSATYNRRHIRRMAEKASIEHQQRLVMVTQNDRD